MIHGAGIIYCKVALPSPKMHATLSDWIDVTTLFHSTGTECNHRVASITMGTIFRTWVNESHEFTASYNATETKQS